MNHKLSRKNHKGGPARATMRGIALLEALIGMLIFAFGVLGLVGLQASVTKAQTASKFRADAANLAADLFGIVQTDHFSRLGLYSSNGCEGYTRCADWKRKVETTLPGGQVGLNTNVAAGSIEVTVSWQQGDQARNSYVSSMVWQQ